MDRVILHCDLNCFYASVEMLSHPECRNIPMAVCGDPEARHGIILAKNEPAKAFGIQTAETIWQARRKCPDLVLLPAHHREYRRYSRLVNEIYGQYTDLVEPFSVDESWLDLTGSLHLFGGDAPAVADELRERLKRELGLSISVGVSFNKVFAKLGSDYKKPDATTVITRENFQDILWPLPVTDMLFVGRAAAGTLGEYGIRTIGDLAQFDRDALISILGKQGGTLSDYARGLDRSPVVPASQLPPPKSVGSGQTFRRDLTGEAEVRPALALLSDEVASRLRKLGMRCGSVQLTIRDPNFHTITRQKALPLPTYLSRELTEASLDLFRTCWNPAAPIRMLTVTAQKLVFQEEDWEQMDLFSPTSSLRRERQEKLERTLDQIRQKYGTGAITLASLADGKLEGEPSIPPGHGNDSSHES